MAKSRAPSRAGDDALTFTERQEAALVLRSILAAVRRGDLDALDRQGRRLMQRLEGAVVGLEAGAATREGEQTS